MKAAAQMNVGANGVIQNLPIMMKGIERGGGVEEGRVRWSVERLQKSRDAAKAKDAARKMVIIVCDGGCGKETTLYEAMRSWWRGQGKYWCKDCVKRI